MKNYLSLIITCVITSFLYGQAIDYNLYVEQLIDAPTDTTDEITMNTHYYSFNNRGYVLESQNMLKRMLLQGTPQERNSRLERNYYSATGMKEQTAISYVDTFGYEFNKVLTEYKYAGKTLVGSITSIGQDSLVEWQNIAYDEQGRKKKLEIRKTKYDLDLDRIIFDQFDTTTYRYNWISDTVCFLSKSEKERYELFLYSDSIMLNKYYREELTFELFLTYDTSGRVDKIKTNAYDSFAYSGNRISIEYNDKGMLAAFYNNSKFRSAEFISMDNQVPQLPQQKIIWNIDTTALDSKAIININRVLITEITPFLEEYFQLWPLLP